MTIRQIIQLEITCNWCGGKLQYLAKAPERNTIPDFPLPFGWARKRNDKLEWNHYCEGCKKLYE